MKEKESLDGYKKFWNSIAGLFFLFAGQSMSKVLRNYYLKTP
jgi:hypothetical protein